MPCGKRPLKKCWDKPKVLRSVKPSRYEQNEASVKLHWKNVVQQLELSYKDDKFWESQSEVVHELVGPALFDRISKIFNLPHEETNYIPPLETDSFIASECFYVDKKSVAGIDKRPDFSMSDFEPSVVEEEMQPEDEEQSDLWSDESQAESMRQKSSRKSLAVKLSHAATITASRNFSRMISSKSFSQRAMMVQAERRKSEVSEGSSTGSLAHSEDDMDVHLASIYGLKRQYYGSRNPHYEMLYCNESETDMIKWKSNYKQKVFEISASDEFSKKAEIMTKKIAKEFYDWWTALGSAEFKSEIRRPEDIEDLFQVWFDEHASRSVMLEPKILPCVLPSIAGYVRASKLSCPRVLKRQIAFDIHAESSPAHTTAFNSSLPQRMKHIPPNNNTETMWHCVKIPDDLRTMSAVWDDVQHLTSTKTFYAWLKSRPHLAMPTFLETIDSQGDKKQPFVVPSDYVVRDKMSGLSEEQELALPVSQYTLELKEVLSKLMND